MARRASRFARSWGRRAGGLRCRDRESSPILGPHRRADRAVGSLDSRVGRVRPALWCLAFAGDELAGFSLYQAVSERAGSAGSGRSAYAGRGGVGGSARRCSCTRSRVSPPRYRRSPARGRRRAPPARRGSTSVPGCASYRDTSSMQKRAVSRLRARCPDCRTLTAVALGPEYECHSCGRAFGAGSCACRARGASGGEAMAEAAWLELPYPEAGVVEEDSLAEQTLRSPPSCPSGRSSSAAAAARTSARSRALARGRMPRGRLARRARRPEHARELAVRQRVGDAAADADRRRRRRAGATSRSSARATSTRRRSSSSRRAGSTGRGRDRAALDGCRLRLRRARLRRRSSPASSPSSCPSRAGSRSPRSSGSCATRRPDPRRRRRLHRPRRADPATSRSWPGSPRALGL